MYLCVISGPSTVGKSKVVSRLSKHYGFNRILSTTTRLPRLEETNGIDYWFVSNEIFDAMKQNHMFLQVDENKMGRYGYAKKDIEQGVCSYKPSVLDISTQGFFMLKEYSGIITIGIFLMPPSISDIEKRLRSRGLARGISSENDIRNRLEFSYQEMKKAEYYDYIIINRDIDLTCQYICEYIKNLYG